MHWEHWDPAKISRRTTDKDRLSPGFSGVELDPLNKNALYFCLPQQPERGQYLLNPRDYPGAQAASAMQFCNYEGLYGPCDIVEGLGGDFMPFFGRNDRFAELPFEIGPRPVRNFDHPLAVAWDTFHELYPAVFINQSDYNYAEGASNNFVSSIYGYGMSDLHRLIGGRPKPKAKGPKLNTGAVATYSDEKFSDCLYDIFGGTVGEIEFQYSAKDGQGSVTFNPKLPSMPKDQEIPGLGKLTFTTRFNRTAADLATFMNNENGGRTKWLTQSGYTSPKNKNTNWIASEVAAGVLDNTYQNIGLRALMIHELGNMIANLYNREGWQDAYRARNLARGIDDPDIGQTLENCVFGGRVGLRTGRIGPNREL